MLVFSDIPVTEGVLAPGSSARCRHCGAAGTPNWRPVEAIVVDIRREDRMGTDRAARNLGLVGLDPLQHPDITQILSACAAAGTRRLRVESNLASLTSPADANRILDAGVRHVRFSLVGSDAARHDALCSTPGDFAATLRGVSMYADAGRSSNVATHISALVQVCRHSLADVPSIVAAAGHVGASSVVVRITDPRLDLASAAAWISSACDTGLLNATWVEVEGIPVCHAVEWLLHLSSNYRSAEGAKAAVCATCPLDPVCGGAALGATDDVLRALRPPPSARQLADGIRRGFAAPEGAHA